MTLPRHILPGSLWLVTRRCAQRQFLLRPDDETNAIFEYCLGEAASRHSIGLIGWLVMSNHYHAIVYDEHGQLPAFIEHLHKLTAKTFNARWGRQENFWSSTETSIVQLVSLDDVFDKLIYVLSNPITADLVDAVVQWPGSSSLSLLEGQSEPRTRPRFYFATDGSMPTEVELKVQPPPGVDASSWASRVRAAVARVEEDNRERRAKSGAGIIGRRAVLSTSPFDSPSSPPKPRALNPSVACKDAPLRERVLKHLSAFRAWYRRARREFTAGNHGTEFPPGTYRMRRLGARCAPFPIAGLVGALV